MMARQDHLLIILQGLKCTRVENKDISSIPKPKYPRKSGYKQVSMCFWGPAGFEPFNFVVFCKRSHFILNASLPITVISTVCFRYSLV